MKNTRLAGHGLQREGKPYVLDLCAQCREDEDDRTWRDENGKRSMTASGHGLCSCGALSPHLTSDRARRNWHLAHKTQGANSGRFS